MAAHFTPSVDTNHGWMPHSQNNDFHHSHIDLAYLCSTLILVTTPLLCEPRSHGQATELEKQPKIKI